MRTFLARRWFLIVLALNLVVGIVFSERLQPISEWETLRDAVVAAVLFLMALPMKFSAIRDAVSRPWAPLLATVFNLGLLPLFGWGVVMALDGIVSPPMSAGILVALTPPCTMASAAVWTRRAGGNDSVAILVTLVTNLVCFVVTPLWLKAMTGSSHPIDLGAMISKLGWVVVLPMFVAQAARLFQPLASWSTGHKKGLGVVSQCGILSMVFVGAIRTGNYLSQASGAHFLVDMMIVVAAVLVIHLGIFWLGLTCSRWIGLGRADAIAVGISGSQKTLMIGLQAGMELQITILPMVIYHVSQLLVDTLIADRLARHKDSPDEPDENRPRGSAGDNE